ncbi:hypothetical protein HFO02_35375 [Rhizobium laguerreae]|uniref:DUF6984 family protein n=1 Tax=Rhizobium laguerreae TaxID=1076926 RepID=UPI001C90D5CC|nr:hypothetical protein [Rhizobium laguerreae]MBY3328763.1 hypothetical protein [Rhizobium laguerreae]
MPRGLTDDEKQLLKTLVGEGAPFFRDLETQIESCLVEEVPEGGLELKPIDGRRLEVSDTVLGSGSIYDVDDVPIIFDLLQYDGYIAKLLIEKADSSSIKRALNYREIRALGYGRGLSLER